MTLRKLGIGLIGLGTLGIIFSLLTDLLPGAKPGIQSSQILGIEVSIVMLLAGLSTFFTGADEKLNLWERLRALGGQVLSLPVLAWVLAGFLVAYILFFVWPMFLNSDLRMNYFSRYIPDRYPVGSDLLIVIDLLKGWFLENRSPYTLQFYPPLTYILFAPLLLVDNYAALFVFFTFLTILCYCFLTFVLPAKMTNRKNLPLVLLFFITGLASYGFQFELERGQYNVLTFLLCLWSIYIFHYHPRYRLFAYLLFSLSVQLKLYPAIFIVMLIDDWRAWKSILVRFAGLGLFNFLLLFVMGPRIFLDFLRMVASQMETPGWGWNGNHSIKAFVNNVNKEGYGLVGPDTLERLRQNAGSIETILLLAFLVLFVVALLISYRRNKASMDPYLLMACMTGAMVIPISNDYTLSIVTAPVALVLCSIPQPKNILLRLISILMVLGISFAYASMLIPFKYKPYVMNNAFPPLFLILIFVTILNLIRSKTPEELPAEPQPGDSQ